MTRNALLMLALATVGCATNVTITSSPPEVAIYDGDTKLGVTPLEVSSDKVKSSNANGFLLRLEREGFNRVWLWVPDGIRGLSVVVNLQPFTQKELVAETRQMSRAEMDAVSSRILEMQQELLLKGALAEDKMTALMKEYPDVGAVHYLAALNNLRKGAKPEATAEAKKAIDYSPGEPDYVVLYRELGGDPDAAATPEAEKETK